MIRLWYGYTFRGSTVESIWYGFTLEVQRMSRYGYDYTIEVQRMSDMFLGVYTLDVQTDESIGYGYNRPVSTDESNVMFITLDVNEHEASPGWVVNKDKLIEYLQELVQRDEEMVKGSQAWKGGRGEGMCAEGDVVLRQSLIKPARLVNDEFSWCSIDSSYSAGHSTPPSYSSGLQRLPAILQVPSTPTNILWDLQEIRFLCEC
ncbi:hypothetical protein Tco_0116449 [Tanacetum coccineum]